MTSSSQTMTSSSSKMTSSPQMTSSSSSSPTLTSSPPSTLTTPGSVLGSFTAYDPLSIRPEDCWIDPFSIRCPLPQLDSRIRYGLRPSLPDMIVDSLSGHALPPSQLSRGKYLLEFTAVASTFHVSTFPLGAPRITAQLLRPADIAAAPLTADLVVRYSRGDFAPTDVPLLLARSFGGVVLRARLGDACAILSSEPSGALSVTIPVGKCLTALEPDTNYEVIIPAGCWSHGSKESPSSARFAFHTVDCKAGGGDETQRASRRHYSRLCRKARRRSSGGRKCVCRSIGR